MMQQLTSLPRVPPSSTCRKECLRITGSGLQRRGWLGWFSQCRQSLWRMCLEVTVYTVRVLVCFIQILLATLARCPSLFGLALEPYTRHGVTRTPILLARARYSYYNHTQTAAFLRRVCMLQLRQRCVPIQVQTRSALRSLLAKLERLKRL